MLKIRLNKADFNLVKWFCIPAVKKLVVILDNAAKTTPNKIDDVITGAARGILEWLTDTDTFTQE